jgi:hypothetical protein
MDAEQQNDGHWHFTLGPVERWIVGACAAALLGLCYGGWSSIVSKQDTQADLLAKVVTQQAVTSAQITTLQAQLADVPSLTRQIAEIKVQADRNTEDIQELRGMRGLK